MIGRAVIDPAPNSSLTFADRSSNLEVKEEKHHRGKLLVQEVVLIKETTVYMLRLA
ncbi:MAG: hypothetical protein Ct9H300mP23_05630 [Nitrospinota bacterium]|nr:MAG: hypothetical protein Ct9H300mP23_05630 [Nitrospinota bacterium]